MRKAMVFVLIIAVIASLAVIGCSKKKEIPLSADVTAATSTNTAVPGTATNTATRTFTTTVTNTATYTATRTATQTQTSAVTYTFTPSSTNTTTPATATFTFTSTSTFSNTYTFTRTQTSTNTPLNTATETGTPTETATETATIPPKPAGWIDDCEDTYGPNQNDFLVTGGPILNVGGYWVTYDDNSAENKGTSYAWPMAETWAERKNTTFTAFEMSAPGYTGSPYGQAFACRVTGYVTNNLVSTQPAWETTTGFQYGFFGMGMQLTPTAGQTWGCNEADIRGYTGIRFYCKGDNRTTGWRLKIPYVNQTNCDNKVTYTAASYTHDDEWGKNFTAPTAWTLIDIPFATLTQEGWGGGQGGCTAVKTCSFADTDGVVLTSPACPIVPTASSPILQHAKQIQIQTVGSTAPATYPTQREIWVDDVYLY